MCGRTAPLVKPLPPASVSPRVRGIPAGWRRRVLGDGGMRWVTGHFPQAPGSSEHLWRVEPVAPKAMDPSCGGTWQLQLDQRDIHVESPLENQPHPQEARMRCWPTCCLVCYLISRPTSPQPASAGQAHLLRLPPTALRLPIRGFFPTIQVRNGSLSQMKVSTCRLLQGSQRYD